MLMDTPPVAVGIMGQASAKDIEKKRRLFEVTRILYLSFKG